MSTSAYRTALKTLRAGLEEVPGRVGELGELLTFLEGWIHPSEEVAISEQLRIARHRSGLKQQEAALLAGLTRGHLSRLERGRTDPGSGLLRNLATVYGCSFTIFPVTPAAADSLNLAVMTPEPGIISSGSGALPSEPGL